jgi:hypothetical protein
LALNCLQFWYGRGIAAAVPAASAKAIEAMTTTTIRRTPKTVTDPAPIVKERAKRRSERLGA